MPNKVREARQRKGWTIQKLSKETGLANGFLSEVETGKKAPGIYNALRIASALETPVEELFPVDEPSNEQACASAL